MESVIAPAYRSAIRTEAAGMAMSSVYGCEGFIRRRRSLTESVIAPAYRSTIISQSAGIRCTSAYRREYTRRRR